MMCPSEVGRKGSWELEIALGHLACSVVILVGTGEVAK